MPTPDPEIQPTDEEGAASLQILLEIADGVRDYDFDAAADLAASRGVRRPVRPTTGD